MMKIIDAIDDFFERNVFENKDKLEAIILYPFGFCWECIKALTPLIIFIIPFLILLEIFLYIIGSIDLMTGQLIDR